MTHITNDEASGFPDSTYIFDEAHQPFVNGESAQLGDLRLSWAKRLTIAVLVVASLFLAVSVIFDLGGTDEPFYEVQAEVLERRIGGTEFEPEYYLTYEYTDHQGEPHTVERLVSFETYTGTAAGREITVGYRKGRRQRAEPVLPDEEAQALSLAFFGLLALILLVLWVLYFWLYRPSQINRRLERDGQFIVGQLSRAWPIRAGRLAYVNADYTFTTPDGDSISQQAMVRRDVSDQSLPSPGTPVLVRYVNPNLYRLM